MNQQILTALLSMVAGFLSGSIPFGYIVGRLKRMDIRTRGSGNIGFTNVQRTIGWGWAIPVLILDVAKGMIPVALATRIGLIPTMVGLGAALGHVFTPWLGFKGGKGVATTVGVAALLCPRSLLISLGLYLLVLLATGFISASAIALAVALPPLTFAFYGRNLPLLLFAAVMALVIIARHYSNMVRLTRRTEPRLSLWLKLFRRQ